MKVTLPKTSELTLLAVENTTLPVELPGYFEGDCLRAMGPLELGRLLANRQPQVLVVSGNSRWQMKFCRQLAPEKRPAIVCVSEKPSHPDWVDEWVTPSATAFEFLQRIQLALMRARARRVNARRAMIDFLTGLPNRRSFVRGLVRESARTQRSGEGLSLVLIDLDQFKAINEREGHAGGDKLLRKVGQALRQCTRQSEWVGRIGGDEFALAVAGSSKKATLAAKRVQQALAEVQVSATVAVGERASFETLRELYRRTDGLLMELKSHRLEPSRVYPRWRESDTQLPLTTSY